MKIEYLGSAAAEGIPAMFCNCATCQKALKLKGKNIMSRSQALIDDTLLVDFNGDTYEHFLKINRTLYDIENIIITHSHTDHFTFEEFFCRFEGIAYNVTKEKVNIYTSAGVIANMIECLKARKSDLEAMYKRFNFIAMEYFKEYDIQGYKVTPFPARHAYPEQAFIFLIEKDGKSIFYGNDTGYFDESIDNYLANNHKHIDLLSLDCTKGDNTFDYYSHMSMKEGKAIQERFKKLHIIDSKTKLYYNHFSHNCMMVNDELVEAAKKYGFKVTHDNLKVKI